MTAIHSVSSCLLKDAQVPPDLLSLDWQLQHLAAQLLHPVKDHQLWEPRLPLLEDSVLHKLDL
eukprot:7372781-Lingulodinium_polyedra.AAC.1